MRILVTGASGFVGATLIPELAAQGHQLRALSRDPARITVPGAEPVRGDVLSGEGLAHALRDVEIAYYLIHSMEAARDHGQAEHGPGAFPERERLGAARFATAAKMAGVRRIVYLGGPLPAGSTASAHLTSRATVERILMAEIPDSVALRASIVIGAGSRSFRLLVRLVERLPVLALPAWHAKQVQPIDARDVTAMLVAAATVKEAGSLSLEIGGPQRLTYEEVLSRIAELMLIWRPTVKLRMDLTPIVARVAAAVASEDPDLVLPLMESLACEMPAGEARAAQILGVSLHSFDAAVEHALGEWERSEPLAAR
ncbi:MAG: NAD(P)H-binding protein [Solirubrobacteraceae bacterium]